MLRPLIVALILALAFGTSARAETDHDHDHVGKHGGVITESSGHHSMELVASDGLLQIYLTDHDGGPEDVKGAKATATVLSGGKKTDVTLSPDTGNFLQGTGDFKAGPGTVVVITLTMPDHEPEQARFKLD